MLKFFFSNYIPEVYLLAPKIFNYSVAIRLSKQNNYNLFNSNFFISYMIFSLI